MVIPGASVLLKGRIFIDPLHDLQFNKPACNSHVLLRHRYDNAYRHPLPIRPKSDFSSITNLSFAQGKIEIVKTSTVLFRGN